MSSSYRGTLGYLRSIPDFLEGEYNKKTAIPLVQRRKHTSYYALQGYQPLDTSIMNYIKLNQVYDPFVTSGTVLYPGIGVPEMAALYRYSTVRAVKVKWRVRKAYATQNHHGMLAWCATDLSTGGEMSLRTAREQMYRLTYMAPSGASSTQSQDGYEKTRWQTVYVDIRRHMQTTWTGTVNDMSKLNVEDNGTTHADPGDDVYMKFHGKTSIDGYLDVGQEWYIEIYLTQYVDWFDTKSL